MTEATVATGTKPVSEPRVVIRPAEPDEAADVFRLISDNLEAGHLLPRPLGEVVLHAPRFLVASDSTGVIGCAELARLGPQLAEVRSLVVADSHRGHGLGTRLLRRVVKTAKEQQYERVCAFAHDPRAFIQVGFSIVPHPNLPEKIATDCYRCTWFRRCTQYAVALDLRTTVMSA